MKTTFYAIKTSQGYLATQGTEKWYQDTPNGWAGFICPDDAKRIAERMAGQPFEIEEIEA